jgi:hypothetical protein
MGRRRIEICSGCGGAFVWLRKTPRATHVFKHNVARAFVPRRGGLVEQTVYTPHVCKPPNERQVARREIADRLRAMAKAVETEP